MKDQGKLLKQVINTSKKENWKSILTNLEDDIWGEGYRIVTGHFMKGRTAHRIPTAKRRKMLRDLFPNTNQSTSRTETHITTPKPFTMEEFEQAVRSMKNGKFPGPDGLTVEALKLACNIIPEKVQAKLKELLKKQDFLDTWKVARVVLLPKEGKDPSLSSSYRPICLLNTIGKLYERLIVNRLEAELEEKQLISHGQHDFRRGRSTMSAIMEVKEKVKRGKSRWCVVVTVDIRNAFNTARWDQIINSLIEGGISSYSIRCVENDFKRRIVRSGNVSQKCTMGVPQGSIKGPYLWNAMYNGVLKVQYDPEVTAVAYADDLLFLVEGEDVTEVRIRAEKTVRAAAEWMKGRGLEIAPQKTEMTVMRCQRRGKSFCITVEGIKVEEKPTLKYFGVVLSKKLNFAPHVNYVIEKASRKCAQLQKIMPNINGPSYGKRRLLCGVIHSIVLYASPVWREVVKTKVHHDKLISIQRKGLL